MNYDTLITAISDAHQHAQAGTAGAVNRHLILRNWLIGAYIIEFEQNGQDRARYGAGLLKRPAGDLKSREIFGLGSSMLKDCRTFYRLYPQIRQPAVGDLATAPDFLRIGQPAVGQSSSALNRQPVVADSKARLPSPLPVAALLRLSWTHLLELIRLDDPWKRAFYENECLKANWSKRQLQRQIGSLLYERTGLSTDRQAVTEHARQQAAEAPQHIADLIRDPYVLEFAGLAEKPHYLEKDLEKALLDHLQSFLLELGTGFCFEARQKRITVGEEHDYLDLVFYHRILRCHLLIDLKTRAFQHGDAGQMNFYLNFWKAEMMQPGDEPPVGLILCTDKKETRVDYATAGLDRQLFVSRYLVALPKPEELERLIETDRAAWEQHHGAAKKTDRHAYANNPEQIRLHFRPARIFSAQGFNGAALVRARN
ncbi:MAG TPA: PDDEXK nuclease domain-containing protein [Verrucomicrobiota bacterium]|nr:PDDEXK nuclease domain-containing protein [Verrucomicrobiota bacterium]